MFLSQGYRRKGKIIKVEREGDGKAQELIVRHETTPKKKTNSMWSWHEEFRTEWSETFIGRKRS